MPQFFDQAARGRDDGVRHLVRSPGIKVTGRQQRGREPGGEDGERLPAAVRQFGQNGFGDNPRRAGDARRFVGERGDPGEPGVEAGISERMTFLAQL